MAKTSAAVAAQPIKAYSYLRFSTPAQSEGDSKGRQTRLAEEYARLHGLVLDESLTFHDLGVSGFHNANVEGGRLGDFQEAVRLGLVARGSYLLVESLDRLSRTVARRAVRILEAICDAGITVVTLSDGHVHTAESLDTDPMSFIWAVLVFTRASEESTLKGQRLRAAWQRKREVAHEAPLTSLCPGWMSLDRATGKFVVNEERAELVRRIFSDTLHGVSPHTIALAFNVEGIKPFGRGKEWHRSYILKLLDSPAVIGELQPHTIEHTDGKRRRKPLPVIAGYFPSIISESVFARVKGMREGAALPGRGMHSGKEVTNIFGGLGRCSLCGGTVTRVNKGRGVQQWHYLVCRSGKNGSGCLYKVVPYGMVETALLNNVDVLIDGVPTDNKAHALVLDRQIRQAEAALEATEDGMSNLLNVARSAPSLALTRNIRELVAEQERLTASLAEMADTRAAISGVLVRAKLTDLRKIAGDRVLNRTRMNAILRQLLDSVVLDTEQGAITLNWKHGGSSEVVYRLDAEHFGFTRSVSLVAPKKSTRVTKGKRKVTTKEIK